MYFEVKGIIDICWNAPVQCLNDDELLIFVLLASAISSMLVDGGIEYVQCGPSHLLIPYME